VVAAVVLDRAAIKRIQGLAGSKLLQDAVLARDTTDRGGFRRPCPDGANPDKGDMRLPDASAARLPTRSESARSGVPALGEDARA